MDNDHKLRAEVVSALEAVTPPAPWLASTVRESLRAHPRRGGRPMLAAARFTTRGLSVAVAVVLVLLLVATAAGYFQLKSLVHTAPAHPGQADVARYAAVLTSDKQALNEAYGGELVVGDWMTSACVSPTDPECLAFLSRVGGAWQRMLYDLDRTPPPAQFTSEHARLRADMQAFIAILRLGVVAFNSGDTSTINRLFNYGIWLQDDMVVIEAYVVYESGGGSPARDAASAAYARLLGRDYDNLHLPALFSSLFTCTLADTACAPVAPAARGAIQAFLADLQAGTPPARSATIKGELVISLGAAQLSLDRVDAAYASGDETALDLARQNALSAVSMISIYSEGILYARW